MTPPLAHLFPSLSPSSWWRHLTFIFGIFAIMTATASQNLPPSIDLTVLEARLKKKSGHHCSQLEVAGQSRNYRLYTVVIDIHGKILVRVYRPLMMDGVGGVSCANALFSEFSTLRFLQKEDPTIHAPRPICYDDDQDGRVGGAWIATVFIEGNLLSKQLPLLEEFVTQSLIRQSVKEIYTKILKSVFTKFSEIGSIHAYGNSDSSCCHFVCCADVEEFCIGPMALPPSNEAGVTAPPRLSDSGPFRTGEEWLLAVACRHLEYFGSSRRAEPTQTAVRLQSKVISQFCEAADILGRRPPPALVLENVNFSDENILVAPNDPTRIVGILGWAGARVVPYWGSERPGPESELEGELRRIVGFDLFIQDIRHWDDDFLTTLAWWAKNWHMVKGEGSVETVLDNRLNITMVFFFQ
ncbi:uncharacterized protein EV420DRAFT_514325 [Desarmillaria tabescens]|uniref:Aminoglycoside phosphotransferase domain-containing protein n=1 Tax=Armillaria tabescens TaxID=1929756 RepID=A0AA39KA05_ARMTA|nr:uncharacterized protein EV420DRAFT_514325 [Desarmillaria tabescens]KAK0457240.1 hypothetical protein EV420DRAFT_514325 [Desarmillaria tabescens]